MKDLIHLDGLLLTKDEQIVSIMNQVLGSFAIDAQVCGEIGSALDAVTRRHLDTVIVDWDGLADPACVVRAARKSSPNSNSIIVAMVNAGSETHALLVGANFMILKPTDFEHANRCMRAAYGTMLQNRRRAARVSVNLPVKARVVDIGNIEARISDVSVGGIALQCEQPLLINQEVLVQFSLPDYSQMIHVSGKVVNSNANGRAGVRFSYIPEDDLRLLENWLALELGKLDKAEMPACN